MKITKIQTLFISLLFIIIFPIPWIFFADRVLDDLLPFGSDFTWGVLPGGIALLVPFFIYKLDTENDLKTKIKNCLISIFVVLLGVVVYAGIGLYLIGEAMSKLPSGV